MSGQDAEEQDVWEQLFSGAAVDVTAAIPADLSGADAIRPAEDAVDFEGEDELADEELPEDSADLAKDEASRGPKEGSGEPIGPPDDHLSEDLVDDVPMPPDLETTRDEDIEAESTGSPPLSEGQEVDARLDTSIDDAVLRKLYPDFHREGVLRMNSLFGSKPVALDLPGPRSAKLRAPLGRTRPPPLERDGRLMFDTMVSQPGVDTPAKRGVVRVSSAACEAAIRQLDSHRETDYTDDKAASRDASISGLDLTMSTAEWPLLEGELMHDGNNNDRQPPVLHAQLPPQAWREALSIDTDAGRYAVLDPLSDDGDDRRAGAAAKRRRLALDMNDERLLIVSDETASRAAATPPTTEQMLEQKYNISNDASYDLLKENYRSRVRATVGNLKIDHSMVALRLQSPHYKVRLSKPQMRSYHRPAFIVRPNTVFTFGALRRRKKKKDRGRAITELLSTTKDLTLADTTPYFLLEYSEEFPTVLSNVGMGSKIINYYRKTDDVDTTRPKRAIGETHVLGPEDRSPFWNFGFVDPGTVVPTLYNSMIRAPLFEHRPSSTDFVLIRRTGGGRHQETFIRPAVNIFVVGQTLPAVQIPGPQSRRAANASKARLRMVVYRLLNKNPHQRLTVRDIAEHFPDQTDMQNRQRLKEFMAYNRAGDDQGYWTARGGDVVPPEEVIREMVTPEDVALLDAMQVGRQRLEDAGYAKTVEQDEDDESGSIEEQLAPWNVTRNFINATQGKAMLALHGEGDPTGRGEGVSFLRTSMKGGFRPVGESVNDKLDKPKRAYNVAAQQKAYEEEIRKIWDKQARSLNVTDEQSLASDDRRLNSVLDTHRGSTPQTTLGDEDDLDHDDDDDMSVFSHTSGREGRQSKILRITRLVRDAHGILQREVDVIRDPNVIRAYVKRRHEMEDEKLTYVLFSFFLLFLLALLPFGLGLPLGPSHGSFAVALTDGVQPRDHCYGGLDTLLCPP